MKYTNLTLNDLSVNIRLSSFEKENAGEYHVVIEGNNTLLNAETQYANIENALKYLSVNVLSANVSLVLKRFFTSDAVNHEACLKNGENSDVAVSIVQQPPLSGAKVSLWAYFVENAQVKSNGENAIEMKHSSYRHLFDMQLHNHNKDEFAQTEEIFNNYTLKLKSENCTLADNAVRTWIFVQ
ncbi:MAG: hypothetical protein LBH32_09400, partial [Dysgonamonadaceae bacterium]|nr:hypothetical protein [Dysgonamonadaceae bacterium]